MYIERRARPSTASAGDRRATGGRPTSDWRATRERPASVRRATRVLYLLHITVTRSRRQSERGRALSIRLENGVFR